MASSDPQPGYRAGEGRGLSSAGGVAPDAYARLFDACPDAAVIVDADTGMILAANSALEKLLNHPKDDLVGEHHTTCYPPAHATKQQETFQEIVRSAGLAAPFEAELVTADQRAVPVEVLSVVIELANGQRVVLCLFGKLTERKRVELALRESEARYRILFDAITDAVFVHESAADGSMGPFIEVNDVACRMLGYTRDELLRMSPRDIDSLSAEFDYVQLRKALAERQCVTFEQVHVTKDRRRIPVEIRCRLFELGGRPAVISLVRDVTDRKRAEEERARLFEQLRLGHERARRLAQQVVSAGEEERSRLSRELHDEASQMFTVLTIKLDLFREKLPPEASAERARLEELTALTTRTANQILEVARSMHPPALQTLGLNAGLEELCREFAQHSGLAVKYRGCEIPHLGDTPATCLYRVVQEALTNVAKHAQAQQAEVKLDSDGGAVYLSIADDGKGMDAPASSSGLGLMGVRERIDQLGGQLTIETQSGKGTRLAVQIPYEAAP